MARTRLVAVLGALAALGSFVLVPPPVSAVPPPSSWVPAGQLDLVGRGYGHGRGLSQHGAQGAAGQGLSYRQILSFYYPGTAVGQFDGWVRVLLGGSATHVRTRSGLYVRDIVAKRSIALPDNGASRWRLRTMGNGRVQVAWFTDRWRQLVVLEGSAGEFRAPGRMAFQVGGQFDTYRGFLRHTHGTTVNVVRMDDYLKGVVPREMPSTWRQGALRAQIVAARTYAAFERQSRTGSWFELYADTRSQVYGGCEAETDRTNYLIGVTPREIRTYDGAPAYTQFSASNGGWSVQGTVSYQPAQADPYDAYPAWRQRVGTAPLQRAYPEIGTLVQLRILRRDGNGAMGGRVELVRLDGTRSDVVITGVDMRTVLGLRSTWFRFA